MEELCWINASVTRLADATVSVDDRGYVLADGVYEVFRVYAGKTFAVEAHLRRLARSCEGIELSLQYSLEEIDKAVHNLVRQSELESGIVYLQATRGVAPRGHAFPLNTPATLMIYTRSMSFTHCARQRVISVPDERWKRCWIKAIALLPNVLAKNLAVKANADEAILVDDGLVQEGSTSNVFIVERDTLITPPIGPKVLPGVTRELLLPLAQSIGMKVEERPIPIAEALAADEAFLTSTTREVAWIGQWNTRTFGEACGEWTRRLSDAFRPTPG